MLWRKEDTGQVVQVARHSDTSNKDGALGGGCGRHTWNTPSSSQGICQVMSSHRITPKEKTSAALEYACTFDSDTYCKMHLGVDSVALFANWTRMMQNRASQGLCSTIHCMVQSEAQV